MFGPRRCARIEMLLILAPFFTLALSPESFAQTTAFTYQGRLTGASRSADGIFDIQFKLFDTPDVGTGTQQGPTLTQATVQVMNGVFTVQLDFGAGVFTGLPRYLEISIRPAGSPNPYTALAPRQPVTSSPYALRSASAAVADTANTANTATSATQLGGITASGFIQNRTAQQAGTNFNISGNGTAGGTLSANRIDAATEYAIGDARVLSIGGTRNIFAGLNSGINTTGTFNSFFGSSAGENNAMGSGNSFFGRSAGLANTTGSSNVYVGASAGGSVTAGANNTLIGAVAGAFNNLSFATAIGSNVIANLSNSVFIGRTNDTVRVQGTLVVSMLGSAGSTALCRNGSNQISNCSSSLRYKTDVQSFNGGLDLIRRLRPISFYWKADGLRDLGFAAEEVEEVEPLLTTRNDRGEIEGVKYGQITTALVNAVKQQQQQIEQQQKLIQHQQRQIERHQVLIQQQQRKLEGLNMLVRNKKRPTAANR